MVLERNRVTTLRVNEPSFDRIPLLEKPGAPGGSAPGQCVSRADTLVIDSPIGEIWPPFPLAERSGLLESRLTPKILW
jgi:hypothetical protein